ncbi:hypothetical protein ACOMHN_060177 [Nucella lapillus]
MRIFKDIVGGSELFTDAGAITEDDVSFTFKGQLVTRKEGEIDDCLFGGNASAEEVQEQTEGNSQTGLDFVINCRLIDGYLTTKKEYQGYFKDYMLKLQGKLYPGTEQKKKDEMPTEVKEFQARGMEFYKKVMKFVDDIVVYFGEHDEERAGTCCFARYLEDGRTVEVYAFKDGIEIEKC